MTYPLHRTLSLLALAVIAAPAAMAQESTGTITGHLRTKAGVAVAGAQIRLTSPNLQGARTSITDANGFFRAPLLPPGQYRIAVVKEGYLAPNVELELGLGQTIRQDVTVVEATSQAVVEVVATGAAVDKTDVKAATNVTAEQMDLLPRATRGMDTVALLSPGVTTGVGNRVQIRGAQTTSNRFLLNGTDIADNVFADTTGRGYYVDDSIQEMQVIQSPVSARFGNFTGGVINAITKSGGNDFSGTFRANLSRTSWSAQAPRGMRPATAPANAGTQNPEDNLNRNYTLQVGGPIIPDRVWFSLSTKRDPAIVTPQTYQNTTGLTLGDGSGAAAFGGGGAVTFGGKTYLPGGPFIRTDDTTFYEVKLTGAITPNHTLELAGNVNKVEQVNRNYINTIDPDGLTPQTNENDYWTVAYRGLLGNSITLEARLAKKHQLLFGGGDPAKGDPIRARYSNGATYIFDNGIFNAKDGGDNRDIYTYIANLQWFSPETGLGTHTLDVGFEILKQDRQAANDQSPTSRQIFVWGRNPDGTYRVASNTATARARNYIALYDTDKGVATSDFQSFYVNDVWAINSSWQALVGVRYDKVGSSDTAGAPTVNSSQISPRFQVTWDVTGDQSWLARASAARYVGKLNDSYTNRFTRAGNPVTESYRWLSLVPNLAATSADLRNLANWDISLAGLVGYGGPLNRFTDENVKSPYADEYSLNLKRVLQGGSFASLTYTQRIWKNFSNDFFYIGDEIQVPLRQVASATRTVLRESWENDPDLERDYKSFEFEFEARLNRNWTFAGNYTYSILKGNGEGSEGNNPPVAGDVIGDWASVHDSRGRGRDYYAPFGYLTGDMRHRSAIWLSFSDRSESDGSIYGSLMLNYQGGAPYSLTRGGLLFEAQTDRNPTNDPTLASIAALYPTAYTRFFGPRGIGRFNDTFNFDLKLGWEIPLWKTRFFTEFTVLNVFNHWQLGTHSTTGTDGGGLATTSPLAGYFAQGLAYSGQGDASGFGTYGPGDYTLGTFGTPGYIGGRSFRISTGIKW